jgi:hypothetical protein
MSQKNEVRHCTNCQITANTTVTLADGNSSNVPLQKRKEEAKQALFLNRI